MSVLTPKPPTLKESARKPAVGCGIFSLAPDPPRAMTCRPVCWCVVHPIPGCHTCEGKLLARGHRQGPRGRDFAQSSHDASDTRSTFSTHIWKGITLAGLNHGNLRGLIWLNQGNLRGVFLLVELWESNRQTSPPPNATFPSINSRPYERFINNH